MKQKKETKYNENIDKIILSDWKNAKNELRKTNLRFE